MNTRTLIIGAVIIVLFAGTLLFLKKPGPKSLQTTPQPTNSEILVSDKATEITTEDVTYFQDFKGFYAYPKQEGSFPGVVMIHEWWGLNDQIKVTAQQLAKEGYHVLAVDLFKGSVAQTPEEARTATSALNQQEALNNLKSAVKFLKDKNATKIASLGWCFGGGQSMQLTLSGEQLDATVIYYGNLVTDKAKLSTVKWPVLGIFADQDQSIKVDTVKQFDAALDSLGIENQIYIYPGVGHAFANPSGQSYAANETRDAWTKTLEFLSKNLKSS